MITNRSLKTYDDDETALAEIYIAISKKTGIPVQKLEFSFVVRMLIQLNAKILPEFADHSKGAGFWTSIGTYLKDTGKFGKIGEKGTSGMTLAEAVAPVYRQITEFFDVEAPRILAEMQKQEPEAKAQVTQEAEVPRNSIEG